ncbi:Tetratricopeptide repeat protein 16 [Bulinus truncatus]|nr:Tetratricopeptide repeat protein 16 [Bulinus truncatus]
MRAIAKTECGQWRFYGVQAIAKTECGHWRFYGMRAIAKTECGQWRFYGVQAIAKTECGQWRFYGMRAIAKTECGQWRFYGMRAIAKTECGQWLFYGMRAIAKTECGQWRFYGVRAIAKTECGQWRFYGMRAIAKIVCGLWCFYGVRAIAKTECGLWCVYWVRAIAKTVCGLWCVYGVRAIAKTECGQWCFYGVRAIAKTEYGQWCFYGVRAIAKTECGLWCVYGVWAIAKTECGQQWCFYGVRAIAKTECGSFKILYACKTNQNMMQERPTISFDTLNITDTPEPDSFFGDSETISSPSNVEIDSTTQVYHRDPGEVNVHQFYPVLEHNFNRKQHGKKNSTLLAITEEDTFEEHHKEKINRNQTPLQNEEYSYSTSLENEDKDIRNQTNENQESVFPTAVDEGCIEAARLRSQNGSSYLIGNKINKKENYNNIITETAWQHYQRAVNNMDDIDNSVTLLNKAINLLPNEPRFYAARAEAFVNLCDFQSAILNYKKACLLDPQNEEFYSRLAFIYYFQGQTFFDLNLYTEALESFYKASEMKPNNVGYSIRSIACLAALQRYNECMILVNKRLTMDQNNPDLYILRARLHEIFRNPTQCFYDVRDALSLNPDHSEGKVMMETLMKVANSNKIQAMEFNIAGKYREALQKMMIAIATNPSVADFHVLRGALYRKLNDFNAAIDDFLLAIEKCNHNEADPVYRNAQRQLLVTYNDFAVECFQKGFYEEALVLLNKALKGEKNEKSLYINRGDCFYKQGEVTFALEDYYLVLELDPNCVAVKSRIAAIHREMGDNLFDEKKYSEAEEQYTKAIEYNPKVGQFYVSRSRVRLLLENVTGSKEDLLLGLLLDPTNDDIISIMSRLFPGKSISDVNTSSEAQKALSKLSTSVLSQHPSRASGQNLSSFTSDVEHYDQSEKDISKQMENKKPTMKFVMCMEEREFYLQQVKEKKKVETKVKDALINRKSLRYNGARLMSLPPPQPKKKKSKSTNWQINLQKKRKQQSISFICFHSSSQITASIHYSVNTLLCQYIKNK